MSQHPGHKCICCNGDISHPKDAFLWIWERHHCTQCGIEQKCLLGDANASFRGLQLPDVHSLLIESERTLRVYCRSIGKCEAVSKLLVAQMDTSRTFHRGFEFQLEHTIMFHDSLQTYLATIKIVKFTRRVKLPMFADARILLFFPAKIEFPPR
jgi:hypothetical protein